MNRSFLIPPLILAALYAVLVITPAPKAQPDNRPKFVRFVNRHSPECIYAGKFMFNSPTNIEVFCAFPPVVSRTTNGFWRITFQP